MSLQTLGFIQGVGMSACAWVVWHFNHRMQCLCVPRSKVIVDLEATGVPGSGKVFDKGLWQIVRERYMK